MFLRRDRPVLCLVTDRTRLAAGSPAAAPVDAVVAQVGAAAHAGVDLVQIRERDLPARELFALVVRCLDAARRTPARIVVNDRADVALAAAAHGVHLRDDSIDAARLRAIAPAGFLLGRSVHSEAEAAAAARRGGLDYLILGSLFETPSKAPGQPTLGLGGLGLIARAVDLPVLAIGGITLDRLPAVIRAGAAGVAAIGLFVGTGDEPGVAAADATRRARKAADAAGTPG